MRVSLILGVCIVLVAAVAVQADQQVYSAYGDISTSDIAYAVTPIDSSIEEIDFYFTNLPAGAAPNPLQLLEGSWSVSTGGIALVQSFTYTTKVGTKVTTFGSTDWRDFTANLSSAAAALQHPSPALLSSGVYLDVDNTGGAAGALWYENDAGIQDSQGTEMYSAFGGSWLTLNTNDQIGAEGYIATLYVTPGAKVNFDGHWGNPGTYTPGGWGFTNSITLAGGFSTGVPEPSALFLATGGLVGLLCYAWRKRR